MINPITLRVRQTTPAHVLAQPTDTLPTRFAVLNAEHTVIIEDTTDPLKAAVDYLRAHDTDPKTYVSILDARFDVRLVSGRLGDLFVEAAPRSTEPKAVMPAPSHGG
jgi:hypothetical protein